MELQFIMDGSADSLNGTIWFPNTPSPPYEQLSPVRQNRCDAIASQHVSRAIFHPGESCPSNVVFKPNFNDRTKVLSK